MDARDPLIKVFVRLALLESRVTLVKEDIKNECLPQIYMKWYPIFCNSLVVREIPQIQNSITYYALQLKNVKCFKKTLMKILRCSKQLRLHIYSYFFVFRMGRSLLQRIPQSVAFWGHMAEGTKPCYTEKCYRNCCVGYGISYVKHTQFYWHGICNDTIIERTGMAKLKKAFYICIMCTEAFNVHEVRKNKGIPPEHLTDKEARKWISQTVGNPKYTSVHSSSIEGVCKICQKQVTIYKYIFSLHIDSYYEHFKKYVPIWKHLTILDDEKFEQLCKWFHIF